VEDANIGIGGFSLREIYTSCNVKIIPALSTPIFLFKHFATLGS
jgi:hypothetical protein